MVRMSMNEITTFSWTFDEDVRQYVEAGYEGIGVWRQKLSGLRRRSRSGTA